MQSLSHELRVLGAYTMLRSILGAWAKPVCSEGLTKEKFLVPMFSLWLQRKPYSQNQEERVV
jgi:hypothetical protein